MVMGDFVQETELLVIGVVALGVIGFSWGGMISILMPSELLQEGLGADVPVPAAFASFYPVCSNMARILSNPKSRFYRAQDRMKGAPVLIYVGTRDDTEDGERPCDALVLVVAVEARALHGFERVLVGHRGVAGDAVEPEHGRLVVGGVRLA